MLSSRRLRASISVLVAYQRITLPCPSRLGDVLTRNQTYTPSARLRRYSSSYGSSVLIALSQQALTWCRSSGWTDACHPESRCSAYVEPVKSYHRRLK